MRALRPIYIELAALAGLAIALVHAASQELTVGKQATLATSRTAPIGDTIQSGSLPVPVNLPTGGAASPGSIEAGNALWATPLSSFSANRERPIFSPSRRPPAAVAAAVLPQPTPLSNQPRRPLLALIGAVAGETNEIAIFVDETTKGIVRLKIGENHSGWTLRVVKGREVTLQRDRETAVLAITLPTK